MDKRPEKWRLLSSSLLAALTVIGMIVTFTSREEGILTAYGAENFKFFTVDSNLFLGLLCAAELIFAAAGRSRTVWLDRLFYIATAAVALTFTVVCVIFGPMVGYPPLFRAGNLYFHLIVPVLGMVSFCAFRRGRYIPLWETALALIPSVLYGICYTIPILLYGARFPDTDWYGFAAGGLWGSILSAGAVFLITWVLALLLRLAAGGTEKTNAGR